MEIKINKEIRNYTESMFFGLSMRQCVFAILGVGFAVLTYFLLRSHLGTETLSWLCMLIAAPFMAMGFLSYNGMKAEEFILVWVRSKLIEPKKICFSSAPFIHEAISRSDFKKKRNKEKRSGYRLR